jgi:hypothetical protein
MAKKMIRNYSYPYVDWRKKTIKSLERKRNRILRDKPPLAVRTQLIDRMLGKLQQEIATIDGLKAGIRWREQCEKSAGFFKQLHQQRTVQQHTSAVKIFDPQSTFVNADIDVPPDRTSDPVTMRETVQQYYQRLYTTDPVQEVEIEEYLNHINFIATIDQSDNDTLVAPITMDDLLGQVNRSPKQSSPGNDGLGY